MKILSHAKTSTFISLPMLFLVWNEEKEGKTEKEWVRLRVNSPASRNGRLELSSGDEHLHLQCFEPTRQAAPLSPFIKPFSFFLTTRCIFNGRGREMMTEEKKTEALSDKRAECETHIRVGNLIILWHEEFRLAGKYSYLNMNKIMYERCCLCTQRRQRDARVRSWSIHSKSLETVSHSWFFFEKGRNKLQLILAGFVCNDQIREYVKKICGKIIHKTLWAPSLSKSTSRETWAKTHFRHKTTNWHKTT